MQNLTSSNSSMTMTAAGLLLAATLAAYVMPTPAAAQHACEPDAHRLCSQFIPDESTVASCLRRNMRNLSAGCRAAMTAGKAAKRAARQKARKTQPN
jgi:cysteine rich repeat protein